MAGRADAVVLAADGGSTADLAKLAVGVIAVALAGGATATVAAERNVIGTAAGGSRLIVLGDPNVSVDVSGGAAVTNQ